MSDDPYLYPGTNVLRNRLGIHDPVRLAVHERALVTQRIRQGLPTGDFDLPHLQAIHHHLFQDLYDWAGKIRTVEISKGKSLFQFQRYIQTGMADVHRRVLESEYLRHLSPDAFAAKAGEIIGDVNYVHPFREGNGRAQLLYLKQLAERAGHPLDLTRLSPTTWLPASEAAHLGRYDAMAAAIRAALA